MRATWLLVLLVSSSAIEAAEPTSSAAGRFQRDAEPFMRMYCADCHGGDEPEGGVRLEFEQPPLLENQIETWILVLQRASGHEMPPEDAPQPSDDERDRFVKWVATGLDQIDCTMLEQAPRATVRRLNRAEYNNVVRDLFGVDVHPADEFPADDVGEGFDNIGEVLSLPPLLFEKYIDAAEQITDALASNEVVWSHVFPEESFDGEANGKAVEQSVRRLAQRAFRRELEETELARLMQLYQAARKQEISVRRSLQLVTQAILISPQFIFRLEEELLEGPSLPQPLSDYAIATRLSFFLWSTIPDDELNALAADGKLQNPDVLVAQARRMLKHPKARALVDNFAGQWLELRQLAKATPDPERYPAFDESLRKAMVEETSRYVQDIISQDKNILDLIDSDYTFVNERLATHYELTGIDGEEFRRVSLPDDRRGGILAHASILTLTSNPTRTSPVKRGKWILENILGTPPPPPPPNVPELEDGDLELLGTLRERMQQHRENPTCAVCHRKMDALGFGFENFDGIGAWRESDGRHEIDPSGELPGKITFKRPAELRQILKANSREFTRCLTRKLLTYALGRGLSLADRCVVDDTVLEVEQNEYRFSSMIVAIVTSDAFRLTGKLGAR